MSELQARIKERVQHWSHSHLLGIQELAADDISLLLDQAEDLRSLSDEELAEFSPLKGTTVFNFFAEASTRTKTSFGLAARRLGANVIEFASSASSLGKGESLADTARVMEAYGARLVCIRHKQSGTPHVLARYLDAKILNAGDGTHEHPTQALLDLLTIRDHKPSFEGLNVTIVGDITHSRVARSNIDALTKMGANVTVCGPPTLIPKYVESLGAKVSYRFDDVIPESDVIMMLRLQVERQDAGLIPSIHEYRIFFALTRERMARAKSDVIVLHPGPMNRGLEIAGEVADSDHSVALEQVANGIWARMAALYTLHASGGGV
jgi:aspartate carbamoyltransferase catalytic subunit